MKDNLDSRTDLSALTSRKSPLGQLEKCPFSAISGPIPVDNALWFPHRTADAEVDIVTWLLCFAMSAPIVVSSIAAWFIPAGAGPVPKTAEIVMSPGMKISADTDEGTICVTAGHGLKRSYTWDATTR